MLTTPLHEEYILIAEDDADDRFLFEMAFRENGFEEKLEFVENGVDMINFLKQIKYAKDKRSFPKYILLDLNMPKKNGREVLLEIKQDAELQHIPIIIFSTTCNEQEKLRCQELGADDYFSKPHSFENLLQSVFTLRNKWIHHKIKSFWKIISITAFPGIVFMHF